MAKKPAPIPKPKNPMVMLAFRVPEHVFRKLERRAASSGHTFSSLARHVLAKHVGADDVPLKEVKVPKLTSAPKAEELF